MSELTLSNSRPDWADDVSEPDLSDPTVLPAPVTTTHKDGTKTTISYRLDESGRRVKTTRRTRTTIHRERVNPAIAERRSWAKFGLEKGKSKGPQQDTTSIAENMQFRPSINWKAVQAEEARTGANITSEEKAKKEALKDKKVKCRICLGEHFTARCPFKDTMAPVEDSGLGGEGAGEDDDRPAAGGLGSGGGGYVPPHLRKGGAASSGERMGGKYERDDLATLRVTNVRWFFLLLIQAAENQDINLYRYQKWLRNKSFAICSNDLAESLEYSWPKTEKPGVLKALLSFLSWIAQTPPAPAIKWTVLAIAI